MAHSWQYSLIVIDGSLEAGFSYLLIYQAPGPLACHDGAMKNTESPQLSLERIGTRVFTARTPSGVTLKVGPAQEADCISPGQLLQLALAGCAAMSADARLAHALGEDYECRWEASADFAAREDLYTALKAVCHADFSGLSEADVAKTTSRVTAAIERACTVSRTLERKPAISITIGDAQPDQP